VGPAAVSSPDLDLSLSPFASDPVYLGRTRGGWLRSASFAVVRRAVGGGPLRFESIASDILLGGCDRQATELAHVWMAPAAARTVAEGDVPVARPLALDVDPLCVDAGQAALMLRTGIFDAIARAMHGHATVGVMVGGGIDSSTILAHAVAQAARTGARVVALALDAEGNGSDRPYRKLLERAFDVEWEVLTPADCSSEVLGCLVVDDRPLPWASAGIDVALARAGSRRGATCILTGLGGDDLFDEDRRFLRSPVRHFGDLSAAALGSQKLRGVAFPSTAARWQSLFLGSVLRDRAPGAVRGWRRAWGFSRKTPWATPSLRRWASALGDDGASRASVPLVGKDRIDHLSHAMHLQRRVVTRAQVAQRAEIQVVDVLFDPQVATLVARLSPSLHFAFNFTRGLFRSAMPDSVPDAIRWRESKATNDGAVAAMLAGPGIRERLVDLANARELERLGLVKVDELRRRVTQSFDDPQTADWLRTFPALSVEAFLRRIGGGGE
jgi:asparagine synthetase B (glutamine-hydrolysing)